jgi:hypothetical protein
MMMIPEIKLMYWKFFKFGTNIIMNENMNEKSKYMFLE